MVRDKFKRKREHIYFYTIDWLRYINKYQSKNCFKKINLFHTIDELIIREYLRIKKEEQKDKRIKKEKKKQKQVLLDIIEHRKAVEDRFNQMRENGVFERYKNKKRS
jgi:lipoate-protein ligase A